MADASDVRMKHIGKGGVEEVLDSVVISTEEKRDQAEERRRLIHVRMEGGIEASKAFRRQMADAMAERGLTQKQVAGALGCTAANVRGFLRSERDLRLGIMLRWCRVLGLDAVVFRNEPTAEVE